MKRTDLIPTLTAALLLAAALSPVGAASLIKDGDFDSLPVGTATDVGKPAGSWFWPASYSSYPSTGETYTVPAASQMSIASAPAGGTGNALRLSFGTTENLGRHTFLPNVFARRVTRTSGEALHVSFDLYLAPGSGGGAVLLGYGPPAIQLLFGREGPSGEFDPDQHRLFRRHPPLHRSSHDRPMVTFRA